MSLRSRVCPSVSSRVITLAHSYTFAPYIRRGYPVTTKLKSRNKLSAIVYLVSSKDDLYTINARHDPIPRSHSLLASRTVPKLLVDQFSLKIDTKFFFS